MIAEQLSFIFVEINLTYPRPETARDVFYLYAIVIYDTETIVALFWKN